MCKMFPCLSPFEIRQQPAREVFVMIERLNDYGERSDNPRSDVVMRPAGDNWF